MDYYESNRPPTDESGLSGGVGFNFNGQIATQKIENTYAGFNYSRSKSGGENQTYTLDVCVGGVAMKLDVYASGPPYLPT